MRCFTLALLATGCLASPPPTAGDGPDGVDGDDDHAGDGQADAAPGADAAAGCAAGSSLDLVWVSEVVFDHRAQDQVSLRGMAIIVNAGSKPVDLGPTSLSSVVEGGAVEATFTLNGGEMSLPPGEAMGALNIGASVALNQFDEEWTNLQAPELAVVLRFDGTGVDTEIPLHLELGGYTFDLSILVAHDEFQPDLDWARGAQRATALCE